MNNKIILLNFPPSIDYSYINKGTIYPSTAVMLIGTLLKNNGFDVHIIDGAYNEDYLEVLNNYIKENGIIYIGMSVMTTQVPFALEASKIIKNNNKNIHIVWGGIHPTLFPEQTLSNQNIDIVVINEGAFTALELAKCLRDNGDLDAVKGIGYKDENNNIHITYPRDLEDIEELPQFDFSLINVENYISSNSISVYQREFPLFKEKIKIMPILTGLGCPYKCQFCINVILKRRYRFRSANSIVQEIKRLQQNYGANTFLFLDEDFFINKKRVLELASLAEKERLRFNWRMWCRVDHFKENYINSELLKHLSDIGYGSMVMGGESANPEILNGLKKGITPDQIMKSLEYLSGTTIFPRYSFMVGLENESIEQIKNTYRFCIRMTKINHMVDIAGPFIFRLYPGSPIYNRLVAKYNLSLPTDLDSWAEFIKKEDNFTDMPWTPKKFQKISKLLAFYGYYALSSNTGHKHLKQILHIFLRKLSQIRLSYLFLEIPFEYWIHSIVRRIYHIKS